MLSLPKHLACFVTALGLVAPQRCFGKLSVTFFELFNAPPNMDILIINGPNLNLLGRREPGIYGNRSFEDFFPELEEAFPKLKLAHFQSNHEGALIDKLHEVGFSHHGIVLNAGGYTHTSVALADAVAAIATPVVEVHLSNLAAREDFRQKSLLGRHCAGCISGFGLESYRLAVQWFVNQQPKRVGFRV